MKALVPNGASTLRDMAGVVEEALGRHLSARGHAVVRHDLASLAIPECKGEFGCWTATPGICVHGGPHRDIARDLIQSDLAVWLTPLTFGGYSSTLKSLLDHCIPLISPWFTTVEGETHHKPRYERFPDVLAVSLVERQDPEATRVFERLVSRNALNMHTRHFLSPVMARSELADVEAHAASWLDGLATSSPPHVGGEPLDLSPRQDSPAEKPRNALLVVGSPRGSGSVSASIAAHFAALLAEQGIHVTTEHVYARTPRMNLEIQDPREPRPADLLVLTTPLYVDSLPAPVTALLERLARSRGAAASSRPRFLAIVNCGFPESVDNDTALAICRQFARQAGLDWLGGLGIGGGGMFAGKPLAQLGGQARGLTHALVLSANAVAQGQAVPDEARRLVGKLPIPSWLYRLFGDWGFWQEARKHGVRSRVGSRPYAA